MDEEITGEAVLDAVLPVHTELGSGLPESANEAELSYVLVQTGLAVERPKPISASYRGVPLDIGFRADIIVNARVPVELKAVETIQAVFKKTTLTDLKLSGLRLADPINPTPPA